MLRTQKYTDEELIAGCLENNRFFQERLYRRYFGTMISMVLRHTNDRNEAITIVNNGFLKVFKKIDKFEFKGSFEGWIRRIVYRSLSDYFRSNSNMLHFLELEDRDKPLKTNALDQLYLEDLMKLIDDLPPATAQIFRLYAIEGFTHVEISKKIGISEGTSKWHLSNARKELRKSISKLRNYAR